ncbi:MAG: TetR/AcrR family transcriptional regulator [Myxococcota bacterium]
MARRSNKRAALVKAAREAFHELGPKRSTLSVIAKRSGVPLGNVYYYFKAKDDLVAAVIADLRAETEARLGACGEEEGALAQLAAYLAWKGERAETKARFGCPRAALAQELGRDQSRLADDARALLGVQQAWLSERFGEGERAAQLAEELHCAVLGALAAAQASADADLLRRRLARLESWVAARV